MEQAARGERAALQQRLTRLGSALAQEAAARAGASSRAWFDHSFERNA
ncbi:MAG TPA: hypothetical protein VFN67_09675 [Polyangiales bacterium]|nr:hypothetical protein [Polyangiales bacterium]